MHEACALTRMLKIIVQGVRRTYCVYHQLLSSAFLRNSALESRLEIPDISNCAPANVTCCSAAKLKTRLLPKSDEYTWQGHHLAMASVAGRGYACESSKQTSIKQITTAGFPYFTGDFRIACTSKHLTILISSSATSEALRMTIHV